MGMYRNNLNVKALACGNLNNFLIPWIGLHAAVHQCLIEIQNESEFFL